MIAKKSPLDWRKFGILNWELHYIEPERQDSNISPSSLFEDYRIDVDFHHSNTSKESIQVLVEIKINYEDEPKPGYKILIHAVGIFDVSKVEKLNNEQKQNLKLFATTNLMIGRLRGLIPILSSHAPFGTYNLPSLDLNDLITQKVKLSQKAKKS